MRKGEYEERRYDVDRDSHVLLTLSTLSCRTYTWAMNIVQLLEEYPSVSPSGSGYMVSYW